MSHDEVPFEEPESGKTFEPLKAASTRAEPVDLGGVEPAGRTIEALNPTTTRTESAAAEDSTPVLVDDPESAGDSSLAQLKGEVRSLRSRNQILRAERTSIAGRKYALEVVIENLKEKLERLALLCDEINAPGELGEALAGIREMVGEARAIAAGKADALEADLESERTAQLQKYQAMETKVSELSEQNAGLKAERDAIREQATEIERALAHARGQVLELEDFKATALQAIDEAAGQGEGQAARVEELGRELQRLHADLAEAQALAGRAAEAESAVESLRRDNQTQRLNLAEAEERLRDAQADSTQVQRLEADLEQAVRQAEASHDMANRVEVERDAALAAVEEAAVKLEKQESTLLELRQALKEIKPVLDELDSENRRLARLVGEARERGRVNIQELLAREQLLRKLERLAGE
jgi:chromosome segregation ATPase